MSAVSRVSCALGDSTSFHDPQTSLSLLCSLFTKEGRLESVLNNIDSDLNCSRIETTVRQLFNKSGALSNITSLMFTTYTQREHALDQVTGDSTIQFKANGYFDMVSLSAIIKDVNVNDSASSTCIMCFLVDSFDMHTKLIRRHIASFTDSRGNVDMFFTGTSCVVVCKDASSPDEYIHKLQSHVAPLGYQTVLISVDTLAIQSLVYRDHHEHSPLLRSRQVPLPYPQDHSLRTNTNVDRFTVNLRTKLDDFTRVAELALMFDHRGVKEGFMDTVCSIISVHSYSFIDSFKRRLSIPHCMIFSLGLAHLSSLDPGFDIKEAVGTLVNIVDQTMDTTLLNDILGLNQDASKARQLISQGIIDKSHTLALFTLVHEITNVLQEKYLTHEYLSDVVRDRIDGDTIPCDAPSYLRLRQPGYSGDCEDFCLTLKTLLNSLQEVLETSRDTSDPRLELLRILLNEVVVLVPCNTNDNNQCNDMSTHVQHLLIYRGCFDLWTDSITLNTKANMYISNIFKRFVGCRVDCTFSSKSVLLQKLADTRHMEEKVSLSYKEDDNYRRVVNITKQDAYASRYSDHLTSIVHPDISSFVNNTSTTECVRYMLASVKNGEQQPLRLHWTLLPYIYQVDKDLSPSICTSNYLSLTHNELTQSHGYTTTALLTRSC